MYMISVVLVAPGWVGVALLLRFLAPDTLVVCCLSFMSATFVILSWKNLDEAWSMLVIPCWATMMIYLNESMEMW